MENSVYFWGSNSYNHFYYCVVDYKKSVIVKIRKFGKGIDRKKNYYFLSA